MIDGASRGYSAVGRALSMQLTDCCATSSRTASQHDPDDDGVSAGGDDDDEDERGDVDQLQVPAELVLGRVARRAAAAAAAAVVRGRCRAVVAGRVAAAGRRDVSRHHLVLQVEL